MMGQPTVDLQYRQYRRKHDIHGIAAYPATMVAPVQYEVLKQLFEYDVPESVMDPFCGSGTALFEAGKIAAQENKDVAIYGFDVNPLATLITKVKMNGVTSSISREIDQIEKAWPTVQETDFAFPNMEKWFKAEVIRDLRKVRSLIQEVESVHDRCYFWVVLADTVRKYSNTRSSTFKLHIKQQQDISKIKSHVFCDFISRAKCYSPLFERNKVDSNFSVVTCDSTAMMRSMEDDSIDLTITSPPYGDNATTVTYGQFSSLALRWMDCSDLDMTGDELESYSSIDTKGLGGGAKSKRSFTSDEGKILLPFIEDIAEAKQLKVRRFFVDYFMSLNEISRVTKKTIAITVGNRTVDKVTIPLDTITRLFLENRGFKVVKAAERKITGKRMPRRISHINGEPVNSMDKEYMLVMSKTPSHFQHK